jgi:benzoyl-CoA 2,3-epoxidase subunit B
MLTEEAHHMFVGETGVDRAVQRCAEWMQQGKDPRQDGALPFDLIQKYLNHWFTLSLDLFGGEVSANAADFFAAGLKGRFREPDQQDHKALGATYAMQLPESGTLVDQEIPLRNALNEVLRDEYVKDCQRGVDRWNRTLEKHGITGQKLKLPHRRFHRGVGPWAGSFFDPEGNLLPEADYRAREGDWLPTAEDRAYVKSLMHGVFEPGKIAGWLAPPSKGINGKPFDFEYVRKV